HAEDVDAAEEQTALAPPLRGYRRVLAAGIDEEQVRIGEQVRQDRRHALARAGRAERDRVGAVVIDTQPSGPVADQQAAVLEQALPEDGPDARPVRRAVGSGFLSVKTPAQQQ